MGELWTLLPDGSWQARDVNVQPWTGGKPSSANTGHSGTLTPVSGDQIITVAGTVFENKDVSGRIEVRAANVTIRNCRINGQGTGIRGWGLVNFLTAGSSGVVDRCTLEPADKSVLWEGIAGHHFTARACDISGIVDGVGAKNVAAYSADLGVIVEDCWIHGFYTAPDTYHSDGITHNDGIQIHTGGGVMIRRNFIDATDIDPESPQTVAITSCVIVNGPVGQTWGTITLEENWLSGAVSHFNGLGTNLAGYTLDARGNLCSNKVSYEIAIASKYAAPGLPTTTGPDTTNGNVRESTGGPITVHRT